MNNNMNTNDPKHFNEKLKLGAEADSPQYIFDNDARLAVRMAWITRRPLLVVGEAGCGKTDLAKAVASQWAVPLLSHVVHARTEATDLLYHFDAVARLADAQVYSALKEQGPSQADPLAARNYIRPGVLWWLIDRSGALNLNEARAANRKFEVPGDLEGSQDGAVVLIDEIDKGTEEVTEGLLEVLDTLRFSVPWTGEKVKSEPSADHSRRLTVITSNGAREMPAPFLRRCIVLSMKLPTDTADLGNWLRDRADAHQGGGPYAKEAVDAAIQVIVDHRKSTDSYRAGLAEFLYLLDAARDLAEKVEEQESLVKAFAPSVTTHKAEAALRT